MGAARRLSPVVLAHRLAKGGDILVSIVGDQDRPVRADDPFETLKQMRQDHPVVRALFDQFGAEIVWN